MNRLSLLSICLLTSFLVGCGNSEVIEATFTNKVVQREICTETVSEEDAEADEETEPAI